MGNMHPALAAALAKHRAGGFASDQEYEAEKQRILRDEIGVGSSTPVATRVAPKASMLVVDPAAVRAAEAARISAAQEKARKSGRSRSFVPGPAMVPVRMALSVEETAEDGQKTRRLLTPAEIKTAQAAEAARMTAAVPRSNAGATATLPEIPRGFEVVGGVMRAIAKTAPAPDPIVEAIRARWKAGEFGAGKEAAETARNMIAKVKAEKPITEARVPCSICKGSPDRIVGKLCLCEGKGYLVVDTSSALEFASRCATCADPLPEAADQVSYTAHLTDGRQTTMHSDSGRKAVQAACASLRMSARGFERITLDQGVLLWFQTVETLCPACHGHKHTVSSGVKKTCVQCAAANGDPTGRITRYGVRFYFGSACNSCRGTAVNSKGDAPCAACDGSGANPDSPEDQAHAAGLRAMTGFDPSRACGRKKCKGAECRACHDAQEGGYQTPGYVRCSECNGTGKFQGEDHERCHGKGYFTVTEFYWVPELTAEQEILAAKADDDARSMSEKLGRFVESKAQRGFRITNEIRRVDLIAEDRIPKRDRNVTINVGSDAVLVGAGKVPSRKSGAFMHLSGTARPSGRFDRANSKPDGIRWAKEPHTTRVTFSGG